MSIGSFSLTGFFIRWFIALVLVMGTANPTGQSYMSWIINDPDPGSNIQFKLLIGGLIAVGYIVYLRATMRSIGVVGVGLGLFIFGTIFWWPGIADG